MDKLQVKITLRESERWFRGFFNQAFGLLGFIQLMGIFMEGSQTTLKFGGITSSRVIRCPLGEACWPNFSRDMEGRDRQKNTNTGLAIAKKIVEILEGKITSDSEFGIGSYPLSN